MKGEALGLIETVGLAAAVEAADTCLKSAQVTLVGYELSKGMGLVTVKITGDVSSVKAALNSASVSASKVNKVYSTLLIPRPSTNLDILIHNELTVGEVQEKVTEEEITEIEIQEEIVEDIYTCNICKDPLCNRKKGAPRKWCLHYKGFEGEINEQY